MLEYGDFDISYQPNPNATGVKHFAADNESDETALIKDGYFFILNGDFRKQYESLAPKGFDECKKFFLSKSRSKSSWSD